MKRKLIAALACRNGGSRLYGKPLQNLDFEKGVSIIDYILQWIDLIPAIDGVVLGISEGIENLVYVDFCKKRNIPYIIGDEKDVLSRLIQCGDRGQATDVFRISTESPFIYSEAIESAWDNHVKGDYDFSCLDNVPDGSGFEIIKLDVLRDSHINGEDKHRSEFCSLYIRENKSKYKIQYVAAPAEIKRTDIRLTIDHPEDLVLCRTIYSHFQKASPRISLLEIIEFLDSRPDLKAIVRPFIEEGLKTMYK
jgi:spore coat polysaccharide biosynthesis protein SpsF